MNDLDRLLELQSLSTNTEGLPYSDGDDEEKELLIKKIQEAIEKVEKYDKKIEFWKNQGLDFNKAELMNNDVCDAIFGEALEIQEKNKSLSEENARLKEELKKFNNFKPEEYTISADREFIKFSWVDENGLQLSITLKDEKLVLGWEFACNPKYFLSNLQNNEIQNLKSQLEQKDKILYEINKLIKTTIDEIKQPLSQMDEWARSLDEFMDQLESILQKGEKNG